MFGKFWKFEDFFNTFLFFFAKNIPPNFQIFKKRNICTSRASKECMYQVSSKFINVFIAF